MMADTQKRRTLRILIINDCAEENSELTGEFTRIFSDRVKCFIATNKDEVRQAAEVRPHVIIIGTLVIEDARGSLRNVHALLRTYQLRSWRHYIPIYKMDFTLALLQLFPRFVHEKMHERLLNGIPPKQPTKRQQPRVLLKDLDTTTLHNQTAGTIVG